MFEAIYAFGKMWHKRANNWRRLCWRSGFEFSDGLDEVNNEEVNEEITGENDIGQPVEEDGDGVEDVNGVDEDVDEEKHEDEVDGVEEDGESQKDEDSGREDDLASEGMLHI